MKLVFPEQSIFWSKAWNLGFGVIIAALFIPIGVKLYPMLGGRIAMNPAYSLSLSIFMILIVAANIRLIVKFPTLLVYCGIFVFSMIIVTLLRSSLSPNVFGLEVSLILFDTHLGGGYCSSFFAKKSERISNIILSNGFSASFIHVTEFVGFVVPYHSDIAV